MICFTCKKLLNVELTHSDGCPVLRSVWCSQCGVYGHATTDCPVVLHVKRPATLEELIPEDVRVRWGIHTHTHIIWPKSQSLEEKDREISDVNTIDIRYTEGKQDRSIRDVMRSLKIDTVHKMTDNLLIIRNWLQQNGLK